MTTEIKEAPAPTAKGGAVISLPPDLTALLEETDRRVRELYGMSPGIEVLAHICIGHKTPGILLADFEDAVLAISRDSLPRNKEGNVDEDSLRPFGR